MKDTEKKIDKVEVLADSALQPPELDGADAEILRVEIEVLNNQLNEFVSDEAHRAIARKMILWLGKETSDETIMPTVRETIIWQPKLPANSVIDVSQIQELIIEGRSRFVDTHFVSPAGFRIVYKHFGWNRQEMLIGLDITFDIADTLLEVISFLKNKKIEIILPVVPSSLNDKKAFDEFLSTVLQPYVTASGIQLRMMDNSIIPSTHNPGNRILTIPFGTQIGGSYYDLCTNAARLAKGIAELRNLLPKSN